MRWSILMNRLRIDLSRIRSINFRRLLDIRCQFSAKGKENIPSSSCPFGGRELNVSLFPRQRRISNYSLFLSLAIRSHRYPPRLYTIIHCLASSIKFSWHSSSFWWLRLLKRKYARDKNALLRTESDQTSESNSKRSGETLEKKKKKNRIMDKALERMFRFWFLSRLLISRRKRRKRNC